MAKQTKTAKRAKTTKAPVRKIPKVALKSEKTPAPRKTANKSVKADPSAVTKHKSKNRTVKDPKITKSTSAQKSATSKKPKTTNKGTRPRGGDPATPEITSPADGDTITGGNDLTVTGSTNRGDFGYIVSLLDITPPGPPAPATNYLIAAPAGTTFSTTIPGTNIATGKNYSIRLYVNPMSGATPPNNDYTISVNS